MKDGVVLLKALDLKIDDLFPHIGDKKVTDWRQTWSQMYKVIRICTIHIFTISLSRKVNDFLTTSFK